MDFNKGFDEQITKLRAFLQQHSLEESADPGALGGGHAALVQSHVMLSAERTYHGCHGRCCLLAAYALPTPLPRAPLPLQPSRWAVRCLSSWASLWGAAASCARRHCAPLACRWWSSSPATPPPSRGVSGGRVEEGRLPGAFSGSQQRGVSCGTAGVLNGPPCQVLSVPNAGSSSRPAPPPTLPAVGSTDDSARWRRCLDAMALTGEQQQQLLLNRRAHLQRMRGIYQERHNLNMQARAGACLHLGRSDN